MAKQYSLNMANDRVISIEVDGIRYYSPDEIPDPADREAILKLMANSENASSSDLDEFDLSLLERDLPEIDASTELAWNHQPPLSTINSWSVDGSTPPQQPDWFARIFVSIFLSVSVVMLAIAGVSGYYTAQAMAQEEEVPGRVIDLTVRKDSSGNDLYYPVVEFTLPETGQQTIQLSEGSWPPAYEKGDSVTVLYNPKHPRDARIQSTSSTVLRWTLTLISGVLGISFLAATFLAIWLFKATSSTSNRDSHMSQWPR